jgi:short-chain Z-isoprenyl diphosphate synthase
MYATLSLARSMPGRVRDATRRLCLALAAPFYGIYAETLFLACMRRPVPVHVGLILDGNRRHARARGVTDYRHIYAAGASKLDEVLDWCASLGIRAVTLWVCSPDNLARPAGEVSDMLTAIEAKMRDLADDRRLTKFGVRVEAMGRLDLLPPSLVSAIEAAKTATATNQRMVVTIATGYGGREEIADAVRALLEDAVQRGLSLAQVIDTVSTDTIRNHLYLPTLPDPDLIIRTSGELRLSGFMLWQSAYSEFYFTDVNWPAFRRIDFLRAIRDYQGRDRRHGR